MNAKKQNNEWVFKLYIGDMAPQCNRALENLKKICEEYIPGQYFIEVIDLIKNPNLAEDDQILAVPTLVRISPKPICKLMGDLSNKEIVLARFNIRESNGS